MQTPPIPDNERERLEVLRAFSVVGTPAEAEFDRFTRLAARLFDVPIALVTLVDSEHLWLKSAVGMPSAVETSRSESFCGHAILEPGVMVVPDTGQDPRFSDNPNVAGVANMRFYAGAPLRTADGYSLGELCVIDSKPRELTQTQRELLAELGRLVMEQMEHRRLRHVAEKESQQLRELLTALPAPVTVHQDGFVVFANAAAEKVMNAEPGSLLGYSARAFLVPRSQTANSTPDRIERKLRTADGSEILVESIPMPLRWQGHDAQVVLHRDVSAQRRAEADRKRATDRIAQQLNEMLAVFDGLPEGIAVADENKRCVYVNQALSRFFGVPRETLLSWSLFDSTRHVASCSEDPVDTRERMLLMFDIDQGGSRVDQFTLVKPRHQVLRREVHRLSMPERPWVVVWTDVTREVALLKLTQIMASTDKLTGLPNRRAAEAELERALATGGSVSVVLFDVDHFKKVNDAFGHDIGDEVLVAVGGALRASARAEDFVARWGGEEFLAIVRADEAGARRFAERVRLSVSLLETKAGHVTISGGLAAVKEAADVKRADAQLYEAKKQGRNRING